MSDINVIQAGDTHYAVFLRGDKDMEPKGMHHVSLSVLWDREQARQQGAHAQTDCADDQDDLGLAPKEYQRALAEAIRIYEPGAPK